MFQWRVASCMCRRARGRRAPYAESRQWRIEPCTQHLQDGGSKVSIYEEQLNGDRRESLVDELVVGLELWWDLVDATVAVDEDNVADAWLVVGDVEDGGDECGKVVCAGEELVKSIVAQEPPRQCQCRFTSLSWLTSSSRPSTHDCFCMSSLTAHPLCRLLLDQRRPSADGLNLVRQPYACNAHQWDTVGPEHEKCSDYTDVGYSLSKRDGGDDRIANERRQCYHQRR